MAVGVGGAGPRRRGLVWALGAGVVATLAVVLVAVWGPGDATDPLGDDVLPDLPADIEIVGGRSTTCEVAAAVRECHRIVALGAEAGELADLADRVMGLFTIGEWTLCESGWEVDAGPCVVAVDDFAKWRGADTACARLCDRAVAVLLVDASSS